ncbi:MAG: DUF3090 family protein [Chloroflexi bacterium]|nr:DUF3090 family protein [Chloroflexota bacterium]
MAESRHDFGAVNRIEAESFGQPGQRTFRVLIANTSRAASLWMEKEQLRALGAHIEGQLGRLNALRANRDMPAPEHANAYTGEPNLDFRVGQLALGFDEREGIFLLLAYTQDDEDEDRPTFSCQATPGQFHALAEQVQKVVNAGRPNCPLCGQPIDPAGHACARANGHLKYDIPPAQQEDE